MCAFQGLWLVFVEKVTPKNLSIFFFRDLRVPTQPFMIIINPKCALFKNFLSQRLIKISVVVKIYKAGYKVFIIIKILLKKNAVIVLLRSGFYPTTTTSCQLMCNQSIDAIRLLLPFWYLEIILNNARKNIQNATICILYTLVLHAFIG